MFLSLENWQVNGIPTPTLDAFLEAVKDIGDKSPVRVKTVSVVGLLLPISSRLVVVAPQWQMVPSVMIR